MSNYGAIKLDICEATSEALNEKLGVTTGFKPSEWAENIGVLVKPTSGDISGDMASFVVTNPIKAISTTIEAVQSGSGTPSPSNVRPISGFDSIKIYRTGKNLLDVLNNLQSSSNGLTFSQTEDNGIRIEGTTTASWAIISNKFDVFVPKGTTVTFSIGTALSHRVYLGMTFADGTSQSFIINSPNTSNTTTLTKDLVAVRLDFSMMNIGQQYEETLYPMLEVGTEVTDYEAFDGKVTTIDFDQTVYGGNLNIKTGELVITHGIRIVESVNRVILHSNNIYYWTINLTDTSVTGDDVISSHFIGKSRVTEGNCYITASGTALVAVPTDQTLNTKALADAWCAENKPQFVYPLATPITVQLSPTEVRAIAGQNNIWTDCGQVSLSYITL